MQGVATVIAVIVQVGVKQWLFATVPDICDDKQASHLSCPNNEVFYAASVIWYVPDATLGEALLKANVLCYPGV